MTIVRYLTVIIGYFLLLVSGCNRISTSRVDLDFQIEKPVIYRTPTTDFHFEKELIKKYCYDQDTTGLEGLPFRQILHYLKFYDNTPIVIPDTLGSIITSDISEIYVEVVGDSLARVRDQSHPYSLVVDEFSWILIHFARSGQLKVFDYDSESFAKKIVVKDIDHGLAGTTEIQLLNKKVVHTQMNWIR